MESTALLVQDVTDPRCLWSTVSRSTVSLVHKHYLFTYYLISVRFLYFLCVLPFGDCNSMSHKMYNYNVTDIYHASTFTKCLQSCDNSLPSVLYPRNIINISCIYGGCASVLSCKDPTLLHVHLYHETIQLPLLIIVIIFLSANLFIVCIQDIVRSVCQITVISLLCLILPTCVQDMSLLWYVYTCLLCHQR